MAGCFISVAKMYQIMARSNESTKHANRRIPILARHAVSLSIAFALGIVLSYFAAQYIHQQIQLGKLNSTDQASFNEGLAYVVTHAGKSTTVTSDALHAVSELPDVQRGADLLLAVAKSHANRGGIEEPTIPDRVNEAIAPLMRRLAPTQAIGLYDGLVQIKGINPITTAEYLLNNLNPKDNAELLGVVDLLDTRLLWSRKWAPPDLWVRWLGVLATSQSELTQAQTVKRLGDLPEAVDDPRVSDALNTLSKSDYETVRNMVLHAVAGYAAIAKDPTDYEQVIFSLGNDANKIIARRAWLIVGHLNPLSGFAVNWQDADPFVAEAMLWAAAMTNPENPKAIWQAYDNDKTRGLSLQALSQLFDVASIQRFDRTTPPLPEEQIDIDPERVMEYLSSADAPANVFAIACVSIRSNQRDSIDLIQRLVRMSQPQPRLLGALLAAMNRAKPTLIEGDFKTLLQQSPDTSVNDLHAMTDEQLMALGLRRVDALPALLDAAEAAPPSANRSVETKLLKLALWMRGDFGDNFTPTAEAMLFDDELPTSTVLMGLLYMKRPTALDYLFGDLVTPRPDLHKRFVQERYWHVFRHFVDTSDLTLWLWGDPEAQAFQLEAMRQWHAVNRWKIEQGWWPIPQADIENN